jgi:hypothetical protein
VSDPTLGRSPTSSPPAPEFPPLGVPPARAEWRVRVTHRARLRAVP